jgi:serine protease AprX
MHQEGHEFAPDILNMSLGAVDDGNPYNSIRVICRSAIDEGLWLVASAGNSGPAPYTITSPACEKYVMAIGSCRQDPFSISDFSSRGPTPEGLTKPDAVMLGEDIIMASSKSDSATLAKSGTSFSAPFASAAASLFLNGQDVWGDFSKAPGMPEFLRRQVPYPMTQEGLIDVFLPATGIKPSGSIMGKDNIYGYGLPYAPLLFEKVSAAADVSSLLGGVLMIGMMGMMMRYMTKVRV